MKTLNKKALVLSLATLLILFNQIQAQTETTAQIDQYTKTVSALMKKQKERIFANVAADGESAEWKEFKTEKLREAADKDDNLNQNAYVWLKNSKVVSTTFTNQSPSRDWVQYVTYYYRETGTLAKVETTFNTFNGNVTVKRNYYFDPKGKKLKESVKYYDLNTKKRIYPKPGDFMDFGETEFYKTTGELAFIKLLEKTLAK